MNADLGLTTAMYGLAAGLFFVTYTLFEIPSDLALARVGARRWIARITVRRGAVAALKCAVHALWQLYAMRRLLVLAVGLNWASTPVFWAATTDQLSGMAAAAGVALINATAQFAGMGLPPLVGQIRGATGSDDAGILPIAARWPSAACSASGPPARAGRRQRAPLRPRPGGAAARRGLPCAVLDGAPARSAMPDAVVPPADGSARNEDRGLPMVIGRRLLA